MNPNLDEITLIIRKSKLGYIGFVKEIDGANTQAKTFGQCVLNLLSAIEIITELQNEKKVLKFEQPL